MPVFTTIGAAVFGAGTFFAGATAFALSTVTSIGVSYAVKALSGETEQQAPAAARVGGVQGTLQGGGEVARSFPLGNCVTAGSLVYANTWGNDGETPNAYFTQVIALSDLPLSGLSAVYVNGELVTLLTGEATERGAPVQEYRKDGKDHLWVKFYDGTQSFVDSFLTVSVTSAERPWGADRVGTGTAYAIVTALVNDTLYSGFPQCRFLLPGIKLYDISKDSTAGGSGSHVWSDPSTWGGDGDSLPAVQIYNILRGIRFNGDWVYGLQNSSAAQLPATNWIEAIAKCRQSVTGESGVENQYRAGHECRANTQVADTVEMLLTACQGRLSEIGGVYKLNVGEPSAPVASFTDGEIISTAEQTFTPFFELAKTVTGVSATYPEPAEAFAMKDAPPLRDADLEEAAGNRRLLADISFDAVPYAAQVQRLMLSALREAQRARRHTITLPPEYWVLEPGDVVEWTSERNGYETKLFRVDGIVDRENLDVMVDLTEVDPADYDFDFGEDFNPVTRSPIAFVRPGAQALVDWFAEGASIYDADGIARRPAILLHWAADVVDDIAGVAFEVRNAALEVVHRGRTDMVDAGEIYISQNLLPNTAYGVRGRYLPANPRDTLWSDWLSVTTPNILIGERDIVQSLLYQIKELTNQFDDRILQLENGFTQVGNRAAATWNDKQVIKREFASRTGAALAMATEAFTIATDTETAFSEYQVTVTAQFDDVIASVAVNAGAIATLDGYAASRYSVTLDVNGYASGFSLINGGPGFSTFTVLSAQFQVAFPGQPGGEAVPVFTIGSVNGTSKLALRGNMLIDGDILARNIGALQINAGHIQTNTIATNQIAINGVDVVNLISNAATKVWDATISGTIAVPHNSETLLCSRTVTCPAACTLTIVGSVSLQLNEYTISSGGFAYNSAAAFETYVRLYVGGFLIDQKLYQGTPYTSTANGGVSILLPIRITAPIIKAVSVPAGTYSVEVRAYCNNSNTAITGAFFTAGGVAIIDSRKSTLN